MTITSRVFDSTVIKFLGNLHKASQVPVPCTLDMEAGALQVQSQFGLCSETLKKRKSYTKSFTMVQVELQLEHIFQNTLKETAKKTGGTRPSVMVK
jgi:hypothetical protein